MKQINTEIRKDQQEAQVIKQAINDDQGLAAVAKDIDVSVKDGVVTLEGEVNTEQQMNLVTNTAKAIAVKDQVNNELDIAPKKESDFNQNKNAGRTNVNKDK